MHLEKEIVLTSSNFNAFLKKRLEEFSELLGNRQDGYKSVSVPVLLNFSQSLFKASRSTEITFTQRTTLKKIIADLHQAIREAVSANGKDTTYITELDKALAESNWTF